MYVCMHVYVCTYTYTCMYAHARARARAHTHGHICMHVLCFHNLQKQVAISLPSQHDLADGYKGITATLQNPGITGHMGGL